MFALIKNNFKLMLRNKWITVLLILFPILTIGLLSNVFNDMLNKNYDIEDIKAGYSIEESNQFYSSIDKLKDICKDNNIELLEYKTESSRDLINNGDVDVFIDIGNGNYHIYESTDKTKEALVIKSIFSSYFYNVTESMNIMSKVNEPMSIEKINKSGDYITSEKLDADPMPSAIDYYGIIEVVFFTWCGVICLSAVISSEGKNKIEQRFKVSGISNMKLYLGKFIPCVLAIIFEIGITLLLSVLLYDVHWGNIAASIGILILLAITASAAGIALFYMFKSMAVSIIVGFILLYIAGFLGGTFQTYMFSNVPINLAKLSPQYYLNRTLVEFSTKGSSDYTVTCIGFLIAILVVSMIIGLILINRKMEER